VREVAILVSKEESAKKLEESRVSIVDGANGEVRCNLEDPSTSSQCV
jgi:phosphoenolpyruvate-protein kinase (PTS system EI component)